MELISNMVVTISDFLWGGTWNGQTILPVGPLVITLLGTGLYMSVKLSGRPWRRFVPAIVNTWRGRKKTGAEGSVTPWQALSTALSGQVGTGNLAGVATALTLGGPGAIFWMWITAIIGMALAFSETALAVKYRIKDNSGAFRGGPMYYIRNGLGDNWKWLAVVFCIGTVLSASATGGMIQSNSITKSVQLVSRDIAPALPCALTVPSQQNWRIISADGSIKPLSGCDLASGNTDQRIVSVTNTPDGQTDIKPVLERQLQKPQMLAAWMIGGLIAIFVALVIVGGISSIATVAGRLVPTMALFYVLAALVVLIFNAANVPAAFASIFVGAFGFDQVAGGFSGGMIALALRAGVARGLFSNEAGQGSAPIAHAVAKTAGPVKQAEIAMIGVFIDTVVICTMTALVILSVPGEFLNAAGEPVRFAWQAAGLESSAITSAAYANALPGGQWIVSITLLLFAFTTIIGWAYYSEQAFVYLFGPKIIMPFRIIWIGVIFIGAFQEVGFVWRFGDLANASMMVPNLIALLALSPVVIALHKANPKPD